VHEENCAKYNSLVGVVKEADMIFLKVDSTVVKQLKELVNNRKLSLSGKDSKDELDILKTIHKQGNNRVSNALLYNA